MFRNYIRTALRNLRKNKLFSFINIFGLASGMTVCMLAMIKIKQAYDYDSFHPNSERSYRIITNLTRNNGDHFLCASSPLPLADYLKQNYSGIEKSTTVYFANDEASANNKKLTVKEAYVDVDFYKIFGFKLIAGSPATKPQTAVLTKETAERFFGKENAIGKIITIGKSDIFLVTGILGKPPYPSHLNFGLLVPVSSIPLLKTEKAAENWADEAAAYTYVQLNAGVSQQTLINDLKDVTTQVNKTLLPPSANKNFVFEIQALDDISPGTMRLYNLTDEPIVPNLLAFALIGLSMLLLAFFNYINLTLARSLDRAREVGIRKVAGALKRNLVLQFLTESLVVAILAFLLANIQLRLISALPTVQNIIGNVKQDKTLWFSFIVFTIFTGLVAGWIPAKVLSAFQPIRVLKGKFNTRLFGGAGLRKTLTVIQFAASLIAIVTLSVFYKQSIYMATAEYGFEKEQILNIELPQNSYEKAAQEFALIPGIERVSGTSDMFGFSGGDIKFIKPEKNSDSITANYFSVSPSFIDNMRLKVIAGRNLPASAVGKNSHFVLVNEEACTELKYQNPQEATGKLIWMNDSTNYVISGVVKDFHYASFKRHIQPLILANQPSEYRILNLKLSKDFDKNIIPTLAGTWKKMYPEQPFEAKLFSEQLYDQHLHKDDLMFMGVLTIMALSIACLGLLGMVIYTTKNREKEVSIRRVMGAELWQVIVVTSKDFFILLLLSVCIGLPIGFITGKQFLQQYAYQVPLGFGILSGSAFALLFLGGLTIGLQTYRSALKNPAKTLRTE